MSNKDQIQRFMFEQLGVRGQLVGLKDSYLKATVSHDYPVAIQQLLGEFMSAATLLSTTIKFNGSLTLQVLGEGELKLVMAECRHNQDVRAIARWEGEGEPQSSDFKTLLGNARMAVTIAPDKGQRYQGIVALKGESLAACLEDYFEQSEQLKTRVWLTAEPGLSASGLLIQVLPQEQAVVKDVDGWNRICQLSDTLTKNELKSLDNEEILNRLYHEEEVRVFPASNVQFKCNCSVYRTLQAVASMGQVEIEEIFSEQPQITVRCEFCNSGYEVTRSDIDQHLSDIDSASKTHTLH